MTGDLIEDYPEEPRGHSCLLLGRASDGQPIHVVCSPKSDYLVIITAYVRGESEWTNGFTQRRQP